MAAELSVNVSKRLGSGFSLEASFVAPAGITALFGPSGSGKTTLLNCVAGLLRPDRGRVDCHGRVLFEAASRVDVPVSERRIGYVFQHLALFPHLTACGNVEFGLAHLESRERRDRAMHILQRMGVEAVAEQRPRELSGGERQRVALARALVTDPQALLLDEPFSGLDLDTKNRLIDDLRAWLAAHPVPTLYVSHDRQEVAALAERAVILERGRLREQGRLATLPGLVTA